MKKEDVIQIVNDFNNLKRDIIKTADYLCKKFPSKFDRDFLQRQSDDMEVDIFKNPEGWVVSLTAHDVYLGCSEFDSIYLDFPLNYLWEDMEVITKQIEEEIEKERIEKEKRETQRIIREREKTTEGEKRLLRELFQKYGKEGLCTE